jgi:hypothetical protein
MDTRDDQMVIVYKGAEVIYGGFWSDAYSYIKNADCDWYLLANCEDYDAIVILR